MLQGIMVAIGFGIEESAHECQQCDLEVGKIIFPIFRRLTFKI